MTQRLNVCIWIQKVLEVTEQKKINYYLLLSHFS